MNLNKTRLAVLAAVMAGVVGLAGCDKGSDSAAPETPAATSEAPATPAPAAEPAAPAAPAESSPAPADSGTASSSAAGETPAPAADSSAGADSNLPQTCQDYFKKAEDLVAKAGGSADQMKQMMDQQRSQMAAIKDQAQLESSCKQALDMLDQQMKQMPQ
ncbi:DUF5339 family protein [Advenella mimigardefordensis]|nr:DUF5339 family protein [Advenella mimigardefordensis]